MVALLPSGARSSTMTSARAREVRASSRSTSFQSAGNIEDSVPHTSLTISVSDNRAFHVTRNNKFYGPEHVNGNGAMRPTIADPSFLERCFQFDSSQRMEFGAMIYANCYNIVRLSFIRHRSEDPTAMLNVPE
jgi:hypothetical protein